MYFCYFTGRSRCTLLKDSIGVLVYLLRTIVCSSSENWTHLSLTAPCFLTSEDLNRVITEGVAVQWSSKPPECVCLVWCRAVEPVPCPFVWTAQLNALSQHPVILWVHEALVISKDTTHSSFPNHCCAMSVMFIASACISLNPFHLITIIKPDTAAPFVYRRPLHFCRMWSCWSSRWPRSLLYCWSLSTSSNIVCLEKSSFPYTNTVRRWSINLYPIPSLHENHAIQSWPWFSPSIIGVFAFSDDSQRDNCCITPSSCGQYLLYILHSSRPFCLFHWSLWKQLRQNFLCAPRRWSLILLLKSK